MTPFYLFHFFSFIFVSVVLFRMDQFVLLKAQPVLMVAVRPQEFALRVAELALKVRTDPS